MDLAAALAFARQHKQAVLTTIKRDGRPQLSNVAYTIDDAGTVRISVTADRAKTANMRRDPRIALHITSVNFRSYVVLEGDADVTPVAQRADDATADELVAYYRAAAGEHPDWDDYRRAMVADRRCVVRLRAHNAYGMV